MQKRLVETHGERTL